MFKKLLRIGIIALIALTTIIPVGIASADTMYENYYNTDDWGGLFYTGSLFYYGQTFTPSISHNITSVDVRMYRMGAPGGNIVANIYATSGGLPNGASLASGSIAGSTVPVFPTYGWMSITLTTPTTLTAGTKYAIVLTNTGGSGGIDDLYVWCGGGCGTGTYSGGDYCYNDGGVWGNYANYDLGFREYGVLLVENPTLTIADASNITNTTARLNATVTDDGGEACDVRFAYGTTNQTAANFLLYDTVTSWGTGYTTGNTPYVTASGLSANTTYYYRAQILNSSGNMTTVDSATFTTTFVMGDVTNLKANQVTNTIHLSWSPADGADAYMLRYSTSSYPADNTTGTLLYNGTALNFIQGSISPGVNYFYSIWGYDTSDNWSTNACNYLLTTHGIPTTPSGVTDPTEPTNWFITTDYTNLSNIPYVYDTMNWLGTAIGMPLNWWWFIIAALSSIGLGIAVAMFTKSGIGGVITLVAVVVIWCVVQILPMVFGIVSGLILAAFVIFPRN